MIKNKRLKKEVEKEELEKYLKGELETNDDASEDASAAPAAPIEGDIPVQPAHSGKQTCFRQRSRIIIKIVLIKDKS